MIQNPKNKPSVLNANGMERSPAPMMVLINEIADDCVDAVPCVSAIPERFDEFLREFVCSTLSRPRARAYCTRPIANGVHASHVAFETAAQIQPQRLATPKEHIEANMMVPAGTFYHIVDARI